MNHPAPNRDGAGENKRRGIESSTALRDTAVRSLECQRRLNLQPGWLNVNLVSERSFMARGEGKEEEQ